MNISDAIPFYRALDFNLVPLGGDKRPVVIGGTKEKPFRFHWQEWVEKAQTDAYWERLQLFDWWADVQGLAAICGPVSDGLVCLDFDGLADGNHVADVAEALGLSRAYPWQVQSPGGGYHLWLRCPGLAMEKGKVKRPGLAATAVELRYTGHYVALPPSVHPDYPNGPLYVWLYGQPGEAPGTVEATGLLSTYEAITVPPEPKTAYNPAVRAVHGDSSNGVGEYVSEEYAQAALEAELDQLARATEGGRNDALNTASFALGQLVADGLLSETEVITKLETTAQAIGLDDGEISATLASGLRAGQKEPRGLRLQNGNDRANHEENSQDMLTGNGTPSPLWLEAKDESSPTGSVTFHPYAVLNGRIVHYQLRREDVIDTPVADFTAAITTEITTEDGQKVFVIEGEGKRAGAYSVEIGAETIGEDRRLRSVLEGAVGALDSVYAGMGGHLGPAVKHLTHSDGLRRIRRYQRTGWAGERFLLPGLHDEDIQIVLPHKLPYGCDAVADPAQGLQALGAWLESVEPEKTTVLLAHALTGPMAKAAGWRNERYGLFVKGLTGTFKTSMVQVLLCLYGPQFIEDEFLIKWGEGATRNGIIQLAASAHDMPFLIDNYKPNTGGGSQDFVNLIHNIMEGSEKVRLNRASELRESKPLLCWPVMTGEDIPESDAASLVRVLTLIFERNVTRNNDNLSYAQRHSGHLPALGRAWVEWLIGEEGRAAASNAGKRLPELRTRWAAYLYEQQTDMVNPMRVATNLALNELAFLTACQHPLLGDLLHQYQRLHVAGLETMAREMAQSTVESLEALRFLAVLRELLATGRALLLPKQLGKPVDERDKDRHIGWLETDDSAYLLMGVTTHLVERYGRESFYSSRQLYSQLEDLGFIASADKGRKTKNIKIDGEKINVVHFSANSLTS